ncbi:hypothetical protein Tco_1504904 [Tanacetum coccineum]
MEVRLWWRGEWWMFKPHTPMVGGCGGVVVIGVVAVAAEVGGGDGDGSGLVVVGWSRGGAWKGLKRRKEAKTIKKRQETGGRKRQRRQMEKEVRIKRISPTQQEMKSKFEDSRTKFAKRGKLIYKEKERKKTTRADHAILKLHFTLEWAEKTTGTNCAITPNIQTEPA